VYYFFLAVVVIGYEATATARWALLLIVRAFFNDTITVAVWAGFHERAGLNCHNSEAEGANQYQYHKDRDAFGTRQAANPFSCFVKSGTHDVPPDAELNARELLVTQ